MSFVLSLNQSDLALLMCGLVFIRMLISMVEDLY